MMWYQHGLMAFEKLITLIFYSPTTRKLAIGGTTFCGAPNCHGPHKIFLWRILLHAPQNSKILWRTGTECATEIWLSVAHLSPCATEIWWPRHQWLGGCPFCGAWGHIRHWKSQLCGACGPMRHRKGTHPIIGGGATIFLWRMGLDAPQKHFCGAWA